LVVKRLVFITLIIVASASLVFAQGGFIGLFGDPGGTDCNLWDNVPGLCSYYAVHVAHAGASACQFAAPAPGCYLGLWLSDTAMFPVTIGNSQTGVAIGYGACLAAPVAVLAINYFCQALTPPCCVYRVQPDPNVPSGQIEMVDCNNLLWPAGDLCAVVNPTADCPCWATPTEESTWGRVKSLYAE
jgi:hypothetical protein